MFKAISRRWFLKKTSLGSIAVSGVMSRRLWPQSSKYADAPAVETNQLVAALGNTIIPTEQDYPGYRRLQQYGITEEVVQGLRGIRQQEFNLFNAVAGELFQGKSFVELGPEGQTEFLEKLVETFPAGSFDEAGSGALTPQDEPGPGTGKAQGDGKSLVDVLEKDVLLTVQKVFRLVRTRVFTVFYQNFPEHTVPRDGKKIPVLKPGDQHQIINPNTSDLVTGWDVANFPGPLSWSEEQERRARWMKIHWHSDD